MLKGKYFRKNTGSSIYKGASSGTATKSGYSIFFPSSEVSASTTITDYGYVNSPDPNAYPPAVSDGYTYTALGQLGAKVRVETGSYTGTGTYGANNPTIINLPFKAKALYIAYLYESGGYKTFSDEGFVWIEGLPESYGPSNQVKWVTVSDTQVSIYSPYGVHYQYNDSGYVFYYIAIG